LARIEKSIEIKASPEKVFSTTKELERMPEWMSTMKSCKITSKKRYGKGVTAHCVMQQMDRTMEYDIEITEYNENEKASWHCDEPMRIDGSMTLKPTDSKTKVTMVMDYELPYSILGQIIDKLKMSGQMEKSMEESLKTLKKMLEG
jgi:uncharacterized membrane protein